MYLSAKREGRGPHNIYRASCQPAHSHSLSELHYLSTKVSTGKMISLHQGREEYFTGITICSMHIWLLTDHVYVHLRTGKYILKYLLFMIA
jgi:hypothetical protein